MVFVTFGGARMHRSHSSLDGDGSSLWLGAVACDESPVLEGAVTADYAVLGGGFSGLAAAYFLKRAEPSARVVVLEADRVGAGASGRCAGIVSADFGLSLRATLRLFGRESAREARRSMEQAVELVERVVRQNGIDCDYERTGLMHVATTSAFLRRVRGERDLARRLGLRGGEWLDAKAVRRELDSPLFLGAAWEPRAALLNPGKLLVGIKHVLERAGVELFERSPAVRIDRKIGRLFVRTPRGGVLAEKVAITVNAYAGQLSGLRHKQVPVLMHAIASEPLRPDQLDALGWRGRQAIADARAIPRFYRLTRDRRLLIGGRDVSLSFGWRTARKVAPATFAALEDDARVLFPALRRLRFPFRWSGPISVPLQLAPALGYLGNQRIVYALGCMGHGIALAHLNGSTIADLLRQERTERTESFFVNRRVVPWPPEPFQTALMHAGRGLLKLSDAWSERGFPEVPRPPVIRVVPPPESEDSSGSDRQAAS